MDPNERLYNAVRESNLENVKNLLDSGVNPNIENMEGKTPLYWAAYTKNDKILKLLLAKGAEPNIEDNEGKTPLYWAAFTGNSEVTKILLQYGANPNKPDKKGNTPLSIAEKFNKKNIVKLIDKRMRTMGPVESVYSVLGNNSPFIHDNKLVRDLHEYTRSEGGKRRTIKKKSNKRQSRIKK